MWAAKPEQVFAAADPDEKHARKMVGQINPEKHLRHGRLLATSGRRLKFCHPMVRAGQARHLLEKYSSTEIGASDKNSFFRHQRTHLMAAPLSDKLAVLIDADNAQAAVASELLAEVARYGTATVKRAYGDWTTTNLSGWKDTLHNLAIQPVQQFRFTVGKNATDSALIIDAMDLLHGGSVDGFCLVSSDSDFTRLATRIREAGLSVYGFGEKKTPKPFVAACDKFIYTEILRPQPKDAPAPALPSPAEPLQPALLQAVAAAGREDGWAALSAVGSLVMKASPSFDPRNYGFQKLGELVRAQSYLEVKSVSVGDGSPNVHLFVRRREV